MLIFGFVFAPPFAHCEQPLTIEDRYTTLHAAKQKAYKLKDRERNAILTTEYERLFGEYTPLDSVNQFSDKDLRSLFNAASLAAYFVIEQRYVNDMQLVLDALERENLATEQDYMALFRSLVQVRNFSGAEALRNKNPRYVFPALPDIPTAFRDNQVTAFDTSSDGSLKPLELDVSNGSHLIVIAHPLCYFSRQAIIDIAADVRFKGFFLSHTIFLAPVSGDLYLDEFNKWNNEYPHARIVQARHESDWPLITEWSTPQFYVVKNGKVASHIVGWPKEGRKAELLDLLQTLE